MFLKINSIMKIIFKLCILRQSKLDCITPFFSIDIFVSNIFQIVKTILNPYT